jgi:hypothetical protein
MSTVIRREERTFKFALEFFFLRVARGLLDMAEPPFLGSEVQESS